MISAHKYDRLLTVFKSILILLFGIFVNVVSAQDSSIAVINATVYLSPQAAPLTGQTILIRERKIEYIGPDLAAKITSSYRKINAKGKFITAGFWNSHVHLMETKWQNAVQIAGDTLQIQIQDMLSSRGFTYAFDLASLDPSDIISINRRILSGEVLGPTIFFVGVPVTSKSPFYIKPAVLPELKTIDEVKAHVGEQFKQGAGGIKIWTASPTGNDIVFMPDSLIRAASALARSKKVPLFAHPTNIAGAKKAIRNGVTVLAHVAPDDRLPWEPSFVKEMIDRKIALIPTLKLFPWDLKLGGNHNPEDPLIKTAVDQLRVFQQAGGTVLFGTDVGYMTDYDPLVEYKLMHAAGMSPRQILAALTINPAKKFGYQKSKGIISKGYDADLIIFDEDPMTDVDNFIKVRSVIHNGRVIYHKPPPILQ